MSCVVRMSSLTVRVFKHCDSAVSLSPSPDHLQSRKVNVRNRGRRSNRATKTFSCSSSTVVTCEPSQRSEDKLISTIDRRIRGVADRKVANSAKVHILSLHGMWVRATALLTSDSGCHIPGQGGQRVYSNKCSDADGIQFLQTSEHRASVILSLWR